MPSLARKDVWVTRILANTGGVVVSYFEIYSSKAFYKVLNMSQKEVYSRTYQHWHCLQ